MAGIKAVAQQQQSALKPDQYRAVKWTMQEGLADNGGNVMLKDVKGFMWIGSYYGELCRFDGTIFKKYIPSSIERGSINSANILALVEDRLHNIWVGTAKGLSRYDMMADTFSNFVSIIDSENTNSSIIPFWSAGNNIYCLESGLQVVTYNIQTFAKKTLLTVSDASKRIEGVGVNYFIVDTISNSLWMLKPQAENSANTGLLRISLTDGKRQYYPWPCSRNNINHRHSAEAMQLDLKRYSIWINSGDGLLEFSLNNKKFYHIDALDEFVKLKDYDRYVGIDLDSKGRVWLATSPKGILVYDPKTLQVTPLFSNHDLQQQTGADNLHIYCDKDGISWTSDYVGKGVYELLPFNPPVKHYTPNPKYPDSLSNGSVLKIIPAGQNKIWIGTMDGLNIFDPNTEKFEVLREKDLPGLKKNVIMPLRIDTVQQKAWLATTARGDRFYDMDLYEMDIQTRQCRPIVFKDGIKQLDTFSITPSLMIAYKNGLLICDENHGLFEIKENSLIANMIAPFQASMGGVVVEENRYIFLQGGGKLPNYTFENKNGKWIKIPHLLDSLQWSFMLYNKKDQSHWVSLKYELVHYDKEFREIKRYDETDGYNGYVFTMETDKDGNLWFTNMLNNICRLNIETGSITTLSETEGYEKQNFDWFDPVAVDKGDNLYFGAIKGEETKVGLDRIYPQRYSSAITSSVYVRSLAVNQKNFPLTIGINNLEKLFLKYYENTISFETGIIDYYAKGSGHLRYKLKSEGKVEDWQYAPAYYTIRYEGLQPGTYQLVMQASNASNEFNSPQKIVTIIIRPPFWQTWWFRIMAIITIVAIIYAIMQSRSRSLRKRNIQLEEKVVHRTKELKLSLEDLKATQRQLIQSEKMASLGELTAGIAHEIQNPLNFVNNFSEVNKELIEEAVAEMDNGNIAEVKNILNDLKDNEQKISHHGKRADAIVKGMLQHSTSGSGKKEPTDINKLADEYLRLAYHGMRAKDNSFNTTLKTDFDESIGNINIISQDIGRVLLNLFNNAFYAVGEKKTNASANSDGLPYEPIVSVGTKKMSNKVEIRVKDNGNGIPPKIVDKIFQPFFTTKPTGQGTGLGLSLSYDIVKAHGGEIKVEAKENGGTDFIIELSSQ